MTAFLRSRGVIPLLCVCTAAVAVIFSPWGSVPAPHLDLGVPGPLVPLRSIALVAAGYLPLLALSPDTRVQDLSSPRSSWLLRTAAPSALSVATAGLVAIGAVLAGVDGLGAVRNLLLGTAMAASLHRAMGPLCFVPPVLGALLCAALREDRAWWATTNQPGTMSSLVIAIALATVALQLGAIRRT